jgi:hypothetical protein
MAAITARTASVLVRHLPIRRLRIAFRDDAQIYPVLLALEELASGYENGSGVGTELAIANGTAEDNRVTVLQAARKAGVTARAIIKAIDSGRLDAHKTGPIWQITERSLARYIAARERQERQVS